MMMAEINVNWRLVSKRHSIYDMARGWFENQCISNAYNQRHRCKTPHLPGGTAIIARGEAALRRVELKADESKLGRWTSTVLSGKDNIRLRLVSVYVPCVSQEYGNKKVYCQQQKALLQMGKKDNPITAFWKDFWCTIDAWLEKGEQLIIGGDWNVDVRKQQFLQNFETRNLIPAITDKHGSNGPETYNRGSKPIDEIFVSASLQVTSAGYLEHGSGLGDHRPIWIEVTKDSALGAKLPPVKTFAGRRLKLKDPRTVHRYLRAIEDYSSRYQLFERIDKLFQSITPHQPLNKQQQKEYERLDQLRVRAMKSAEKKCRKLYKGQVQWSPKLQRARDKIKYIRNSISHEKGTKVNKRTLIRDSKRAQYTVKHLNLQQMEEELDKAFTEYKEIKKNHKEIRQSYLEELAQAMEDYGNGKKATHLRNLIRLEEQREMYKKLKRLTGKNANLSTTFVTVTDENGNKKDLIDKEAIEKAIMEENVHKYHQTEDTCPFINNTTLFNHFGRFGEGPASNLVFNGTYTPPIETDQYTSAYLKACKAPDIPGAEFNRDCEKYKRSWEVIKEQISSRELHYGHFKAACRNDEIINMHYQMSEIPFRTGYAPERWKGATQVMILKKEGLHRIEKLRTIVLYEADFNHNNKWFGRQLMQHTKQHNLMAKEQYSVPGKKSIDHALNRRLIFDIARYQKSSIAMTSCDLKSCYDRIAHTPALLAIVGYRYLPTPIFSMFTCIQDMQWTTRTVYGDSDATFGGLDDRYIVKPQGMGQGNGAGPPVWSTVSSRMFEVLHANNLASTFASPFTKGDTLEICGFAFVDDSDIIASLPRQNDPDATVAKMQAAIDCWEGVAKTTGGALEPSKSWWYLIHFEWKNGDWSYGDLTNVLKDTLTALDKTNNRVELEYLPSSAAQTMLGVELAPDGNNKMQFKTLLKKSKQYAEFARTGHMQHSEAWITLTSMALKSIEYGLPASTFSDKQLNQIMSPLLSTYLPRSGIQRNVKRDLLYGPIKLQGLGLQNPILTQGISHVVDLIDNQWKGTITGTFISQCLEHLRMELGCNNNILQSTFTYYQPIILTESWISHVWEFMSKHKIHWNDQTATFPLRRDNDKMIMEELLKCKILKDSDKKKANKCRIYLRVASLADITTGDGKMICSWALKGKRNLGQARMEHDWPLWGQPSKDDWSSWRRVLRYTFCSRRGGHLDQPLGRWIVKIPDHWQWFTNCFSDYLYFREDNRTWKTFKFFGRKTRFNRFSKVASFPEPLPPLEMMTPTTIQEYKHWYIVQGTAAVIPTMINHTTPNHDIQWLQFSFQQSPEIDTLLHDINSGTAIAVSDGSYDPNTSTGAAAWIIESNDASQWLKGTSISPGPPDIQSAYRSEILGILAILHHLYQLCENHDISSGRITVSCDGISALRQATRDDIEKLSCRNKQSDLLSACTKLSQLLPLEITPQHVKGHQDELVPLENLSREERLNIVMDLNAKTTLKNFNASNLPCYRSAETHPLSFKLPKFHDVTIYENIKTSLYDTISGEALHEYWIHCGRYTAQQKDKICWRPIDLAMKRSNLTRRRFISKWISDNVATGYNMKRWKKRPHDYCPFCRQPRETTQHILQCTHPDMMTNWNKHLCKYLIDLFKLGLSTSIILPLKAELTHWKINHNKESVPIHQDLDEDVALLLRSQRELGWKQFLEGLYTDEWIKYINEIKHNRQTTDNILSKMIQKGWNFIFAIWEERNHRLHHTDHIFDLEGRTELLIAMEAEWKLGLSLLPASDYAYYFTKPLPFLKNQQLDWQKDWLATIKQGRELYRDHRRLDDGFSRPGPLRDWIGMTKTPFQNTEIATTS